MKKQAGALIIGAAVATAAAVPAIAQANRGGEDSSERDVPITGPDLNRASQAALDFLGGGRVTGTEIEDEESYYEVEVTLDDGRQVDVQLDREFTVVGSEGDSDVTDD